MATSTYSKETVALAAKQKIQELQQGKDQLRETVKASIEETVREQMKPKWYRPWRQREEVARRKVGAYAPITYRLAGAKMQAYSNAIRKASRIKQMVDHSQGWITLDHDEVHFLFTHRNQ